MGWRLLPPALLHSLLPCCTTWTASRSPTTACTVLPSDTAGQLKASIHERTGLPEDKQCLYYGGKPLDDERTLESQRVTKGATVELRLRVLHEFFHEDSS